MPSDLEFQSSSEETSDEVLNFKLVRFNSCVILPSEKACCQLDYQPESQKASDKMSIQDFILLKTVSSGTYGKVILARKKAIKDLLADYREKLNVYLPFDISIIKCNRQNKKRFAKTQILLH